MIRPAVLVLFVFLLIFFGCHKKQTQQVQSSCNGLQSLPERDRKDLDSFFQLLCRGYDFVYTLFGEKPMSVVCYLSHPASFSMCYPQQFLTLEKGWKVWENYNNFFPSKEFVVKKCKDGDISAIYLLNKKQVLNIILQNQTKFEQIVDQKIDPQEFLKQLCDPEQDIMKLLNDSSELLGILLGYGKTNAMLFERKYYICMYLNAKMIPPYTCQREIEKLQPPAKTLVKLYRSKELKPDLATLRFPSKYDSLADELNDILLHEECFEVYGSDFFLDRFISPVFMMRKEDPETQELQKSYFATKVKLIHLFQQGSFLEIILNQWMCSQ